MTTDLFACCTRPPRFDLVTPEALSGALPELLADARQQVAALEATATPNWAGLMQPLHESTRSLWYAWNLVGHATSVMDCPAWREVDQRFRPEIVDFSLQVSQNPVFFRLMEEMRNGSEWLALPESRQRILESALRSARQAGVGLQGAAKQEFNDLQKQMSELGMKFSNNVLDATKAFKVILTDRNDIAGLPPSVLRQAAQLAAADGHPGATPEAGPWKITLDIPIYLPFMKYAERRELRERLLRAFVARASSGDFDNRPLVEKLLALHRRSASLLGFATYADQSLSNKMAGSVAAADQLVEELRSASYPVAGRELAELREFARASGCPYELMNWDVAYWAEKLRASRYDYDEEALRPYFQFPKVMEGMFKLAGTLFGVSLVAADGELPVWHPDVQLFKILDERRQPLAWLYVDAYSRPGTKRGGAWMNPAMMRERLPDGSLQFPVAYVVCNQAPPANGQASQMSFTEVTTMFHEFGHALQQLLTMVDDPDASGIGNIEWDAVELASQFMENWCFHKETLLGLTAHAETGETLPEAIFAKIYAARQFRAASNLLRQCHLSALDLELYARHDPSRESVLDAIARIDAAALVMPALPEDRFYCAFTHIFCGGYSAGYYSYKWSEVLSADAFSAFEEAGLDNPGALQATGRRYRDTILALGGSRHPRDVFQDFRGRAPSTAALLRHYGLKG